MNIRRLLLDVDKAIDRPSLPELAEAIAAVEGVRGLNITVTDIDLETVGTDISISGDSLDVDAIYRAIERAGAVVHSIDEIVCGEVLESVIRRR